MANSLKSGDNVVILAGKEKGKTGKIVAKDLEKGRVKVAGINIVSRHTKPRSQKEKGGIKKEEASIDLSNVQIICPACGKATRIAHTIDEKGNKHRSCKKCKAFMDGEKKTKAVKSAEKVEKKEKQTEEKAEAKPAQAKTPAVRQVKKVAEKTAPVAQKVAKPLVDSVTTKRKTPQAKSQGK